MLESQTHPHEEIVSTVDGHAGVITLNRPYALNALSLSMIREMTRLLTAWRDDPRVSLVVVQSATPKAFCAGGDIRSVYEAHLRGDREFMSTIFQEEYLLNFLISVYPKPYVSFLDGLALGGGLGISVHGSHCLVTERALLGMPETNIGFFPDVGASYFLNRCPGEVGTFLGLLGEKVTGEDALYAGLGTHRIASSDIPEIYKALRRAQSRDEVDDMLQDAAGGLGECFLQNHRSLIDRCFSYAEVEEIIAALTLERQPQAHQWLKEMSRKSPTSLKLTLAVLRRTKRSSLKEALALEFRVSQQCVEGSDLFEGVRAILVDKDYNPRWRPAHLSDVTAEMIKEYMT